MTVFHSVAGVVRTVTVSRVLAMAASLTSLTAQEPPTREAISASDLNKAIEAIQPSVKDLSYDADCWVNETGKVRVKEGGKVVDGKGLSCSPFASAVLLYAQSGTFAGIDKTVHAGFGAEPLAQHYQLGMAVVDKTPQDFQAILQAAEHPTGVFLFEVRATVQGKPQAHVGFLVVGTSNGQSTVRQIHFSELDSDYKKGAGGLKNDGNFFEYIKKSQYGRAADAKVKLWSVTKPQSSRPPVAQDPVPQSRVRCLVVGIDGYAGQPLEGCVADAQGMGAFLKKHFGPNRTEVVEVVLPGKGGAPGVASWSGIKEAIDRLCKVSTESDSFYFYFSGHGTEGTGELVAADKAIPTKELAGALGKVKSTLTTVIIDACFSGKLHTPLQENIKSPTLIVVTAVNGEQTAKTCQFEGGKVCPTQTAAGSVFTQWLITAMKDCANDTDKNGYVSWREAERAAKASIDAAERYRMSSFPWFAAGMKIDMTPVFFQRVPPKDK